MPERPDIRLNVLLVSRRNELLNSLDALLRHYPGLHIERKLVVNGHVDPMHDVVGIPDALVLHLGDTWRAELEALAARPADRRPPLIVLGSAPDPAAMRLAMQAGARDLLPLPLAAADLVAALQRIETDRRASTAARETVTSVFLNAKGGCGGTFLACNTAHALAAGLDRRVALVDLDLQFGTIPLYFDLFPERGLLQAIQSVSELDATALEGYLVHHPSGLAVFGQSARDTLPLGERVSAESTVALLKLLATFHDHVLIDLPRHLDALACSVIERAHHIVLVVQQSVPVLRDASRLMGCLRKDLAVSADRLLTVVNRYDKRSDISLDDLRNTLPGVEIVPIPNDYRNVEHSIATGQPLSARAASAPAAKAILGLSQRLAGQSKPERRGLLARTLSRAVRAKTP